MRMNNNHNGFSLVELSIVLVIIGLLVGLGSSMIGPMMNFTKVRETRDMQDANLQSIIGWASSRNSIPTAVEFASMSKSPKDAWGQDMLYLYDGTLNTAPITKDTICGRRSTVLKIDAGSGVMNDIALAILSRADNADITAFKSRFTGTLSGDATHVSGAVIKIISNVTPSGSAIGTIEASGTNQDLVRWVTLDELRSKIGCQGAPLKIVNNELPVGAVGAPYPSAAVGALLGFTIDGGATPGTFRWCIEAATATPLPTGLAFSTVPAIRLPGNSCNSLVEASWTSAATLSISGTPGAGTQGSYSFTVFVRDNNDATGSNDNIAQKTFVLTVNPQL